VSSLNLFSSLRAGVCVLALVLSACGGGGGGGDNGTPNNGNSKNLTLSASSVSLATFPNDFNPVTQSIQVSWTSSKVAGFVIGTLPGQNVPVWLSVDTVGTASPVTVNIHCNGIGMNPGHYAMTLRFVSGDANQNILGQRDIQVACDVVQDPTVNASALTWVETEAPADRNINVTLDPRVSISGVSSDVAWLSATNSGNTITLKATANSATLAPGNYSGALRTSMTLGSRTRTIVSPLNTTVTRAMSGPASLSFVVDATTVAGDLSGRTTTIATATAAQTAFTVQSDAPWLSVTGNTTGTADNLALTIVASQLPQLTFGIHTGTLLVTPANGAQPLQIPINIDMRLPEINFVAPVAFTDTLDTDYVIVRGAGFGDPAFQMRIDGVLVEDPDIVSDTEIRLVPGQRNVGDHPVTTQNALGIQRGNAQLRVADPPNYHDAFVPFDLGPQTHLISSPINGAVFTSRAYFIDSNEYPPVGNWSVVNRFTYDATNLQWTRTEHPFTELFDIAMSPDESQLLVLTSTNLLILDPATMQTLNTYPLPSPASGIARILSVLNNGTVFAGVQGKVFSLRTRTWTDFPWYIPSTGLGVSLDGSRALFGEATNSGNAAYQYIDASTNAIIITDTFEHYCCGMLSRHATRSLVNANVLDEDFHVLGSVPFASYSGDVSPDGTRAVGPDYTAGTIRSFDLTTTPFTELPPIAMPSQVWNKPGRLWMDPAGRVAFITWERYLQVVELP